MSNRVLVVDDDAPIRSMVVAVLKHESFAVDICANGDEALARLDSEDYGALVLSLVHRDPLGDDRILVKVKEKPNPPRIVIISAGSQTVLDHVASDLIRARLRKPFQIEELVRGVKSCFDSP
jgi:DNA-binding response OmpR family regulator